LQLILRLFKIKKNGFFGFGISSFISEIFLNISEMKVSLYYLNERGDDVK